MTRGKFIVFEGIDGSGKTTQAIKLRDHINLYLANCSLICEGEEEPFSGDLIGGVIRAVLSKQIKMPEDALAHLYVANRLTHISNMLPKLEQGNHIICDRYYFSNFAYNQTSNTNLDDLIQANKLCMSQLRPDIVFYLRIPPELAAERRIQTRLTKDVNDSLEKQIEVSKRYDEVMELFLTSYDQRIEIIDCVDKNGHPRTPNWIADKIWDVITKSILTDIFEMNGDNT